jgi:hypothetical protein
MTKKPFTIHRNKYKYQKNFGIGNSISVGIIVLLLLLFSTFSAFHIERLYAQNLEQGIGTFHVPDQVSVQSLPYPIYTIMVAEDNSDLSSPIHDVSVLRF